MFPRPRFIYVSPWLLAAATGLLVLIVVTFALSNIQREKRLMTNALVQKADTLMRVIHSGARASYIADLRRGNWNIEPWYEHVQRVIDHLTDDPDIRFLALVDARGRIIAHSNRGLRGEQSTFRLPEALRSDRMDTGTLIYQVFTSRQDGRIFSAFRSFIPYRPVMPPMPLRFFRKRSPETGDSRFFGANPHARFHDLAPDGTQQHYYVAVGLDMQAYDRTLGRLRFQILMLSLAMLLVGVGGWLSLAAVQGYRISQQTLAEIQAFTGLLIARLPVGIIATDRNGRVTTWNRAAARILGVAAEDVMGREPGMVLPRQLQVFFSPVGKEADSSGDQGREAEVRVCVNGSEVVLICYLIDIRDKENNYMGQVLLLSDVTELKAMEKEMRQNERLAAVGRMAAGVAHEVRNPLSSVKGLALLLRDKFASSSRESEMATLLVQEVERMNRTISELLSFARPASLALAPVHLEELLRQAARLIDADAASDGISITLTLEEGLPAVMADRDRLNQVFINIMLNGVQSMDQGGELRVAARGAAGGRSVEVIIEDTGSGMDPETMEQVFYPYFTTREDGTGIGLAISQKIISDHGGSIRMESEPGRGTRVTIELPVWSGQEEQCCDQDPSA
ncbi:two-component system sensor histidine kinase NtrB [Thermodesulfobacteriota bacterium B35]